MRDNVVIMYVLHFETVSRGWTLRSAFTHLEMADKREQQLISNYMENFLYIEL